MRRALIALAALGLLSAAAAAQMLSTIVLDTPHHYVGPGDTVGFTAFYGLRAYSAAVAAAGTQSALDLRRASDNATCTAKIGKNGAVDLTVGTPCNGATQTVTAWIGASSARVTKMYDQTNGNACGGASCDVVQATAGNQPILNLTGCGAGGLLPCLTGAGGTNLKLAGANNFTPNASAKVSFSAVAERVRAGGAQNEDWICSNNVNCFGTYITNDTWVLIGISTSITAAATDSVMHSSMGVITNASSTSVVSIDGVETTTGATISGSTAAGKPFVGLSQSFTQGFLGETGFADNATWSSATRTALCHNMRLYWGTGGTC